MNYNRGHNVAGGDAESAGAELRHGTTTPAAMPDAQAPSMGGAACHRAQPSCSDGSSGALMVVIDSDSDSEADSEERKGTPSELGNPAAPPFGEAPADNTVHAGVAAAQPACETLPEMPEPSGRAAATSSCGIVERRNALPPPFGEQAALLAPSAEAELRADPARVASCRWALRRFAKQQAAFDCADRCVEVLSAGLGEHQTSFINMMTSEHFACRPRGTSLQRTDKHAMRKSTCAVFGHDPMVR